MEMYEGFHYYTARLQMVDALGDVYVNFSLADTAEQKFMLTRDILTKYDILPKALHFGHEFNSAFAQEARFAGNDYFKLKKYLAAINMYTESLINSKPGSECWAYALANRSAALFHTKHYHHCLKDIGRALKSQYPPALMFKLYERAGHAERLLGRGDLAKHNYNECLKHLDNASMSDDKKNSFKIEVLNVIETCKNFEKETEPEKYKIVNEVLLGGKNECIPALSNYLEFKYSKNMGRGVYATRDINPGDVVAIDDPYLCRPFSDIYGVCQNTNCIKLSIAAIPCPKCLIAIYCDEECMQKAAEEHHHVCGVMCSIAVVPGDENINELVIKWFLRECSKIGLGKFCSLVNQLSKTKIDPRTRGIDENGLYKSDNFLTAYNLDYGENKFSMDLLFFFNCICVELLEYLMLSGFDIPQCYLPTVGASFVHMFKVLDVNCTKINFSTKGIALYPSISLFNHSCDPNLMGSGLMSDKRIVLKAVQPIPKGNQLFICYGLSYKECDKESRNKDCRSLFKTECCCQPCQKNWPTVRYIPNRLSLQNILDPNKDKISMLSSECDKFIEFKDTTRPEDFHRHLNYLYSFLKLLFINVKRPFALYEECVDIIYRAHITINDEETAIERNVCNELMSINII